MKLHPKLAAGPRGPGDGAGARDGGGRRLPAGIRPENPTAPTTGPLSRPRATPTATGAKAKARNTSKASRAPRSASCVHAQDMAGQPATNSISACRPAKTLQGARSTSKGEKGTAFSRCVKSVAQHAARRKPRRRRQARSLNRARADSRRRWCRGRRSSRPPAAPPSGPGRRRRTPRPARPPGRGGRPLPLPTRRPGGRASGSAA